MTRVAWHPSMSLSIPKAGRSQRRKHPFPDQFIRSARDWPVMGILRWNCRQASVEVAGTASSSKNPVRSRFEPTFAARINKSIGTGLQVQTPGRVSFLRSSICGDCGSSDRCGRRIGLIQREGQLHRQRTGRSLRRRGRSSDVRKSLQRHQQVSGGQCGVGVRVVQQFSNLERLLERGERALRVPRQRKVRKHVTDDDSTSVS